MSRTLIAASLLTLGALIPALPVVAEEAMTAADRGRATAFDRKKGNCLACHAIQKEESPGTIGPPLVAMDVRYPDKAALRAKIWDATKTNPDTAMPPFGRHQILSEQEIDDVTAFISSL